MRPELVLSNTTTFFSGNIEAVFRKAKKYGFKYLEVVPYRWTKPVKIYELSRKYGIEIAGIHMPPASKKSGILEKLLAFVWEFYLGSGSANPGLKLAEVFVKTRQNPVPYLLFHADVVYEMGGNFDKLAKKLNTVVENIPYQTNRPQFFWNPIAIRQEMRKRRLKVGLVFDPGHFHQTQEKIPRLNLLETYQKTKPEIIHISYHDKGIHTLPNQKEQKELRQMLKLHKPQYIVIETNPLVSVKKGKEILEKIIDET
ncbi:MAG: hypothetical protein HY396_02645 [Candidatus Doudnabacteria bacterium]|nr:hypothetical protein [Candidatus Doudnabacteria bacterium]